MGVEARICGAGNVTKGQHIQLLEAVSPSDVDGEEDDEGDDAANEANDRRNLQETKEEIAVDGLMVEHVSVRNLEEGSEPVEQAFGKCRGSFPKSNSVQAARDVRTGLAPFLPGQRRTVHAARRERCEVHIDDVENDEEGGRRGP